jgi:hypothetical protein
MRATAVLNVGQKHFASSEPKVTEPEHQTDLIATVATVAVVGVGAAALEAALLPGIVLGVAAMCTPQFLRPLGKALSPLFKSTVRGAYKIGLKTREMVAQAQDQVQDIVAEIDAKGDLARRASKMAPKQTAGAGA